ncbi:methyltransferase domain-containing protein [Halococcus dombrowskii]|uniref:tRNA (guanine(10)-N(2))-dimethyltransferase n=1 Tax=Halococcus dombrowskii TaxID=179637 RepID=A0AAV3SFT9_HALDO|nr:methyltransferase domain-containing protein [Halococcus dombrowskii]UOO95725.1 methyltransferase domain-containing protein [Halococcus dombrowskii]
MYALELGGEDDPFAAREAASAASGVEPLASGLALADEIDPERLASLAFTLRASRVLARTDGTVESAREELADADLDREGTVAVRARDVRRTADVDTQLAERRLGGVLTDRGYAVDLDDPDHELRALFADDSCILGWLAAESERGFGARAPTEKPFFQPGSMSPLLARALANIAGARPGATIVDPMCGTGGVLVEAGLVGARVLGFDAQSKMVRGAATNLDHYLDEHEFATARADATRLPLRNDAADAVIFDAPYGRQSKIEGELDAVVSGALTEAKRVALRAVIVGDRSWLDEARAAGWSVEDTFERRVHRSLVRHIAVLG